MIDIDVVLPIQSAGCTGNKENTLLISIFMRVLPLPDCIMLNIAWHRLNKSRGVSSLMLSPGGQQDHGETPFVWLMILWYNTKFIDMDVCAS